MKKQIWAVWIKISSDRCFRNTFECSCLIKSCSIWLFTLVRQAIRRYIWRCTVKINRTNAFGAPFLYSIRPFRSRLKRYSRKFLTNQCDVSIRLDENKMNRKVAWALIHNTRTRPESWTFQSNLTQSDPSNKKTKSDNYAIDSVVSLVVIIWHSSPINSIV